MTQRMKNSYEMAVVIERAKEIAQGAEGEFRHSTTCRIAQALLDMEEGARALMELLIKKNVEIEALKRSRKSEWEGHHPTSTGTASDGQSPD